MADNAVIFFGETAGKVIAVDDPGMPANMQATIKVDSLPAFETSRAFITRIIFNEKPSISLMNTVGGAVHLYVFGDDIGGLMVSGLAFDAECDGDNKKLGIENIIEYYRENKVSKRREILSITIGETNLRGYLIGINGESLDPKVRIWQFNLQFALIPDPLDFGEGGGSAAPGGGVVAKPPYVGAPVTSPGQGGNNTMINDPISGNFPLAAADSVRDSGGFSPSPLVPVTGAIGYSAIGTGASVNLARGFAT